MPPRLRSLAPWRSPRLWPLAWRCFAVPTTRGPSRFEGWTMTAEQIFSIANVLALVCWILLALLPNRRWVTEVVTGGVAPALFALTYIAIVIAVFPRAEGSFS